MRWLLLAILWLSVDSCPTNRTLYAFCKCDSSFSGVLLDCSNVDPLRTLEVLAENQAQLGLVQQLIIHNTTLRQLQPGLFKGLYIKKLDLSNNQIESVSDTAFAGLENILQSLVMQRNRLSTIPVRALEGMAALLQIDFSNNTIGDLEESQAFRNTPKLYDVSLADNRICNIHKEVFEEVKHAVQTLNLGGNCMSKVPAAALRGFKQLLALHLHNNRISQLEPLQFMNLPLLNLINLARNSISSVHRQTFLNVPNLRLIYLTENNISQLVPQQFRHFEALEMLDLTGNQIQEVPTAAFSDMSKLSQLYLGRNQISTIRENAFANSSLTILLLPDNELTTLNQEMFQWMSLLQQLSLKNNKIATMAQNTFYHMPSLVMLDVSGNQLQTIPPAAFLTQLNMFLVDFTGNRLISTPYNAFNKRAMTVILQAPDPQSPDDAAFVQDRNSSPTAANNTTTIYNPLVTLAPEFFTPHPLIRPAGPPIQPVNNFGPNPSPQQPVNNRQPVPGRFPGQFGPPTDIRTPQPPIVPAGGSITVPVKAVPIDIEEPLHKLDPLSNIPQPRPRPPTRPWRGDSGESNSFPNTQPSFPTNNFPSNQNFPPPNNDPRFPNDNAFTQQPYRPTPPPQWRPEERRTILPYPVPFLKNNPINPAYQITHPPTTTPEATLPPGIITAGTRPGGLPKWTAPHPRPVNPWETTKTTTEPATRPRRPPPNTIPVIPERATTELPLSVKTLPPKKPNIAGGPDAAVAGDFGPEEAETGGSGAGSATTTIAVCLTVVVLVMIAVFITLCVVRHRNSRRSESSASRTSAYVAAQAARVNYASNYGTASMARLAGRSGQQRSRPGQTWIYSPDAQGGNQEQE